MDSMRGSSPVFELERLASHGGVSAVCVTASNPSMGELMYETKGVLTECYPSELPHRVVFCNLMARAENLVCFCPSQVMRVNNPTHIFQTTPTGGTISMAATMSMSWCDRVRAAHNIVLHNAVVIFLVDLPPPDELFDAQAFVDEFEPSAIPPNTHIVLVQHARQSAFIAEGTKRFKKIALSWEAIHANADGMQTRQDALSSITAPILDGHDELGRFLVSLFGASKLRSKCHEPVSYTLSNPYRVLFAKSEGWTVPVCHADASAGALSFGRDNLKFEMLNKTASVIFLVHDTEPREDDEDAEWIDWLVTAMGNEDANAVAAAFRMMSMDNAWLVARPNLHAMIRTGVDHVKNKWSTRAHAFAGGAVGVLNRSSPPALLVKTHSLY